MLSSHNADILAQSVGEHIGSSRVCPWCKDGLASSFEPNSRREFERLCRSHQAEHEGLSLDGLDRVEADERADMANLGYYDR